MSQEVLLGLVIAALAYANSTIFLVQIEVTSACVTQ